MLENFLIIIVQPKLFKLYNVIQFVSSHLQLKTQFQSTRKAIISKKKKKRGPLYYSSLYAWGFSLIFRLNVFLHKLRLLCCCRAGGGGGGGGGGDGNILHNPRINCLKRWLFEGKNRANEQLIKMRGVTRAEGR